jgi:hypothetical protein
VKQVPFQYSVEAVPVLNPGERRSLNIKTQADSYFVCRSIIGSYQRAAKVSISDDASGRAWSSDPDGVREASILGTAQRPYWMTEPVVVPPTSTLILQLINLDPVNTNAVQVVFDGYKHFDLTKPPLPEQASGAGGQRRRWFQYVLNKSLAASNRETDQIKIQADSFFVAQEIVATSTGLFKIKVQDSGSGRNWTDTFIHDPNYVGTAQYPKRLQPPTKLNPTSTVQVELEDESGFSNDVQIVLTGYKQFVNS